MDIQQIIANIIISIKIKIKIKTAIIIKFKIKGKFFEIPIRITTIQENIIEEENNSYSTRDSENEDESHIYFTGSITVSKTNNNNSNKTTNWIVDSGTGIILTKDIKKST